MQTDGAVARQSSPDRARWQPASNQLLALNAPGELWLVLEGSVDLFYVAALDEHGEPRGARHPLFRVEHEYALWPLLNVADSEGAVFAAPAPGTELRRLPVEEAPASVVAELLRLGCGTSPKPQAWSRPSRKT
jgi:hypothetical protein